MPDKQQAVLDWLDDNGIRYTLHEHAAVFTMAEMYAEGLERQALIAKNLFLQDKRGKKHFLVSVAGDKRVDLAALGERLGTRLSFASERRLARYLNVAQGAVTPLGVLFDEENAVQVLLDEDLRGCKAIGMHPAVNTATVVMPFDELLRLLKTAGNPVEAITIPVRD